MEKKSKAVEFALNHSLDQGNFPDVFDENIGMDFHLESQPQYYPRKDEVRDLIITVTSFRGMCAEAIHYYATIHADGIKISYDAIDEKGNKYPVSVYGYLGEEFKNLPYDKQCIYSNCYDIEVTRPVTQEDIDKDPSRWELYDVGSKTPAFEDPEEAIKIAKKVAKARFPKGWKIIVKKAY